MVGVIRLGLAQRFYRKTRRWERFIYRSTAIMLGLLIISQLLMISGTVRSLFNRVEALEGRPYRVECGIE